MYLLHSKIETQIETQICEAAVWSGFILNIWFVQLPLKFMKTVAKPHCITRNPKSQNHLYQLKVANNLLLFTWYLCEICIHPFIHHFSSVVGVETIQKNCPFTILGIKTGADQYLCHPLPGFPLCSSLIQSC